MKTVKLDATGDLALENGRFSFLTGTDAIVQRLDVFYRHFVGDWFLDLNHGIPYHGRILVRGINEGDVAALMAEKGRTRPGVLSVSDQQISTGNSDDRRLFYTASHFLDTGDEESLTTELSTIV